MAQKKIDAPRKKKSAKGQKKGTPARQKSSPPQSKKKSAKGRKKQTPARQKSSPPEIAQLTQSSSTTGLIDPRAMEKVYADLERLMNEQEFESIDEANAFLSQFIGTKDIPKPDRKLTSLEQAQDKMYDAWDAEGDRRVKLAREALAISPDCVDAYVLLAEEAESLEESKDLLEKGVQAGRQALGDEFFEENVGHFWGILETRPYMRALAGLARLFEAMGEGKLAIERFRELLRLNPNDNQGNRYEFACVLLKENADEELGKLLEEYKDDARAAWLYTHALWIFRKEGATRWASGALVKAFKQNPFVPLYLLAVEEIPDEPPDFIELGGETEAIDYVGMNGMAWLETEGAIPWFVETLGRSMDTLPLGKKKKGKRGGW
jgi:tetratricopeptide (TPR) repeat protein